MINEAFSKKSAGILMPLFSMRSSDDWGVGDFDSLDKWLDFFSDAGTGVVQILPINEMAPGQTCPYNALSGFAADPVYISVKRVPDVNMSAEARDFIASVRADIDICRHSDKAHFLKVRDLKLKTLWFAYKYFINSERGTPRAQEFEDFKNREGEKWLNNYAVFRALKDFTGWQSWTQWEEGLKFCRREAVQKFVDEHPAETDFYKYLQWLADEQIRRSHNKALGLGMKIFGDIPFGLNMDSSDVWAERINFDLQNEVGAPPDQFSTEGQKWGLPAYNWDAMRANNFDLWRRKIERACELYDIFRLDHMIGFFRTYIYQGPEDKGHFDVEGEPAQVERGVNFLKMAQAAAGTSAPVAEDLGVIPDSVRAALLELEIPGYKVLRWEHDHGYYREPRNYPYASIATLSTHDTEPFKLWWDTMPAQERANIWEMCSTEKTDGNVPFSLRVQEMVLRRILTSNSALAMFSVQDILGTEDRVNVPGTVNDINWTYKIDCPPECLYGKYAEQLNLYTRLLNETGRAK